MHYCCLQLRSSLAQCIETSGFTFWSSFWPSVTPIAAKSKSTHWRRWINILLAAFWSFTFLNHRMANINTLEWIETRFARVVSKCVQICSYLFHNIEKVQMVRWIANQKLTLILAEVDWGHPERTLFIRWYCECFNRDRMPFWRWSWRCEVNQGQETAIIYPNNWIRAAIK